MTNKSLVNGTGTSLVYALRFGWWVNILFNMDTQRAKILEMKRILFFSLVFFIQACSFEPKSEEKELTVNLIDRETDQIYESLVEVRRDLHRYPELSEQEKRTSTKIISYLDSIGLDVKTNIGGYGVVGILKGAQEGKHVAWRADIDALATDSPDVVDFASLNKGVRHICGHDVHTTIGLGIASVLAKHRDKIKGTIYFIFQPSEEIWKGAQSMIADGLFDLINPSEMYALHITPLPVGQVATKGKEVYSYFRRLTVQYKGEVAKDEVVKYTQDLMRSHSTANEKFWDLNNIMDPEIGIVNPNSIYADYIAVSEPFRVKSENNVVEISSMIYATDSLKLDSMLVRIRENIGRSAYSTKLLSVQYEKNDPTVYNDAKLTQETLQTIAAAYGKNTVAPIYGIVYLFNDDFSFFQKKVPGVYYLLGGSNFEKGIIAMPHSANFAVDEEAIRMGVKYFSTMLLSRLDN